MAINESARLRYTLGLNPKKTDQLITEKIARLRQLNQTLTAEVIRQVNREALNWIQVRAAENLQGQIRANKRPDILTHRLEEAIMSDRYSAADGRGIRFLIDAKIRHDVPYYASLEYGDRSQVGRRIPFYFLGTAHGVRSLNHRSAGAEQYGYTHAPAAGRNNAPGSAVHAPHNTNYRTDRIIGPREARSMAIAGIEKHTVRIQRPVPQYRYGRNAGDSFTYGNVYEKILDQHIRASRLPEAGVKLVIHGR